MKGNRKTFRMMVEVPVVVWERFNKWRPSVVDPKTGEVPSMNALVDTVSYRYKDTTLAEAKRLLEEYRTAVSAGEGTEVAIFNLTRLWSVRCYSLVGELKKQGVETTQKELLTAFIFDCCFLPADETAELLEARRNESHNPPEVPPPTNRTVKRSDRSNKKGVKTLRRVVIRDPDEEDIIAVCIPVSVKRRCHEEGYSFVSFCRLAVARVREDQLKRFLNAKSDQGSDTTIVHLRLPERTTKRLKTLAANHRTTPETLLSALLIGSTSG